MQIQRTKYWRWQIRNKCKDGWIGKKRRIRVWTEGWAFRTKTDSGRRMIAWEARGEPIERRTGDEGKRVVRRNANGWKILGNRSRQLRAAMVPVNGCVDERIEQRVYGKWCTHTQSGKHKTHIEEMETQDWSRKWRVIKKQRMGGGERKAPHNFWPFRRAEVFCSGSTFPTCTCTEYSVGGTKKKWWLAKCREVFLYRCMEC